MRLSHRILPALAATATLSLAALFALRRVETADLFWHLAAGRQILETGSVPRTDPFAWLSLGRPWLDVHWLAQVVLAVLERLGGIVLLQLTTAATVVAALAVALRVAARGGWTRWPVALLAVLAAYQRFEPRPDVLSLLFIPAVIGLLEQIRSPPLSGHRRLVAAAALFGLETLWVNVHGSFALGPLIAAAWLLGAVLARPAAGRIGPLAGAFGLTLAATCLNPRGLTVWRLFRPYVDAVAARLIPEQVPAFAPRIQEWLPPFSPAAEPYLRGVTGPYLGLLALSALALVLAVRARDLSRAATLILLAALSATALRHIAPFAFAALAIVPPALGGAAGALDRRARGWLRVSTVAICSLVAGVLVWGVGTNRFFVDLLLPTEVGPGLLPTAFPEGACGWVEAAGVAGQAFHNYEVGGYYLWRFDRRRRPLLDGRLDLLAPQALERYTRAMSSPVLFEELATDAQVTHVILKYATADSRLLFPYLESTAGSRWRLTFHDASGAVYLRADLPQPNLVVPHRRQPHPWDLTADRWFAPLARRQVHLPAGTLNLALFAETAGQPVEATRLYLQAVTELPSLVAARVRLALLYQGLGHRRAARAQLDWLAANAPDHPLVGELRRALGR